MILITEKNEHEIQSIYNGDRVTMGKGIDSMDRITDDINVKAY